MEIITEAGKKELDVIQDAVKNHLNDLATLNSKIKKTLEPFSDNKNLKGDEVIGWLGEIYGKALLLGKLVDDQHDIEANGKRISVKARKGNNKGWQISGIIYRNKEKEPPTDLMFIHFNDDYTIDRIWLYDWNDMINEKRLKAKKVGDDERGFIFKVRNIKDRENVIYSKPI